MRSHKPLRFIIVAVLATATIPALAQNASAVETPPPDSHLLAGLREYPAEVVRALIQVGNHPDLLRKLAEDPNLMQSPEKITPAPARELVDAIRQLAVVPDAVMIAASAPDALEAVRTQFARTSQKAVEDRILRLREAYGVANLEGAIAWQRLLEADPAALGQYRDLLTQFSEAQQAEFKEFPVARVLDRLYYTACPPDPIVLAFADERGAGEALTRLINKWEGRHGPEAVDERILSGQASTTPPTVPQDILAVAPKERRERMWTRDQASSVAAVGLIPVVVQPPGDQPMDALVAHAVLEHARFWLPVADDEYADGGEQANASSRVSPDDYGREDDGEAYSAVTPPADDYTSGVTGFTPAERYAQPNYSQPIVSNPTEYIEAPSSVGNSTVMTPWPPAATRTRVEIDIDDDEIEYEYDQTVAPYGVPVTTVVEPVYVAPAPVVVTAAYPAWGWGCGYPVVYAPYVPWAPVQTFGFSIGFFRGYDFYRPGFFGVRHVPYYGRYVHGGFHRFGVSRSVYARSSFYGRVPRVYRSSFGRYYGSNVRRGGFNFRAAPGVRSDGPRMLNRGFRGTTNAGRNFGINSSPRAAVRTPVGARSNLRSSDAFGNRNPQAVNRGVRPRTDINSGRTNALRDSGRITPRSSSDLRGPTDRSRSNVRSPVNSGLRSRGGNDGVYRSAPLSPGVRSRGPSNNTAPRNQGGVRSGIRRPTGSNEGMRNAPRVSPQSNAPRRSQLDNGIRSAPSYRASPGGAPYGLRSSPPIARSNSGARSAPSYRAAPRSSGGSVRSAPAFRSSPRSSGIRSAPRSAPAFRSAPSSGMRGRSFSAPSRSFGGSRGGRGMSGLRGGR